MVVTNYIHIINIFLLTCLPLPPYFHPRKYFYEIVINRSKVFQSNILFKKCFEHFKMARDILGNQILGLLVE